MLTIRRRGAAGIFYCRGTVRVGAEKRLVKEHTTGLSDETLAESYRARLQAQIETDILYGRDGRAARLTFADIGLAYLERPEGLAAGDVWRIGELNEFLGDYKLRTIREGWAKFRRERCAGLAPATVERFRATLQAALNHGEEELDYDPPKIRPIRLNNKRLVFLTVEHAERLTMAYADHVQPIALTYRYTGCRTQEALQLQIPQVDFKRQTVFFDDTKNGEPRTVKLADRVAEAIDRLLHEREYPEFGHVFLNRLGEPYDDTRLYTLPGGNPLKSAHRTALKRATIQPIGAETFRVHDWRHHWASHCVMNGVDPFTLKRLGGWKDIRSVDRYAAVSTEHMDGAIEKLAVV